MSSEPYKRLNKVNIKTGPHPSTEFFIYHRSTTFYTITKIFQFFKLKKKMEHNNPYRDFFGTRT